MAWNRLRIRDGSGFIPTPSPWICSVYFRFHFIFFPDLNVMRRGSHERAIDGLRKPRVFGDSRMKILGDGCVCHSPTGTQGMSFVVSVLIKGLWPEKPVPWNMAFVAQEADAPILAEGCKITRGRSPITAVLNRIVIVHKRRRPAVDPIRRRIEHPRSLISQFVLKKVEVQILVHDVPVDELPPYMSLNCYCLKKKEVNALCGRGICVD
ncbi:monooxygenase FAD-binding [Striga asiatica]|uniref:Monooxygenase FAD-binding n=1 Tax=Striga asiatica TaxID=4170 RepID=A0A5A7R684_STRAF|nr:monooxygenase FAD-binding [Striga asiatica]